MNFKVIVIGDSDVGKTSLLVKFYTGKFLENVQATIVVDFFQKAVIVDGEAVKLQIWDTAGQEKNKDEIVSLFYRKADGVIFVYDATKYNTFEGLRYWLDQLNLHLKETADTIPKTLIGNKIDCTGEISVPSSLGRRFADGNDMKFFETSAKDGDIDLIFRDIAQRIKAQKPQPKRDLDTEMIILHTTPCYEKKDDSCCCES